MVIKAVIGANYGDEGKGLMTDYFCHQALKSGTCLNILTNGGPQRGHTVVTPDGKRHVFHHFGSGTYAGADTYISKEFVVNPMAFMEEYHELRKDMSGFPTVYVNVGCLVTTPYDMIYNTFIMKKEGKHNSCGYGIYETKDRNESLELIYSDIFSVSRCSLERMLNDIKTYYESKMKSNNIELSDYWKVIWDSQGLMDHFIDDWNDMYRNTHVIIICNAAHLLKNYDAVVFENAQGLLLDKDLDPEYGTSSNTGIEAVEKVLGNNFNPFTDELEICYVSRTYLTRHGDGPFPEESSLYFKDETNIYNEFQGNLRYGNLDYCSLRDRIINDSNKYPGYFKTTLALTHADELNPGYSGLLYDYISNGPTRNDVKKM